MGASEYRVEVTDSYEAWWRLLALDEKESVGVVVRLLRVLGPRLPFPYSSGVKGSAYRHMRELRVQHRGRPFRILYAFDPRRTAILLLGGDKTGDGRWYERLVPRADRLYETHLRGLEVAEQDPTWRKD